MDVLCILLAPFAVYVSVRLGSAAYFKSKQQFDSPPKRNNHA
jgi:hypothetical protein